MWISYFFNKIYPNVRGYKFSGFNIIFKNNKFNLEWEIIRKKNNLIIYKNSNLDGKDFLISLHFEINPLILRKIYKLY